MYLVYFDALMRKKLGGNKELMEVPEPGNDPATPLDLALGITPPAPTPVDLQDQGINPPPLQTNPRPKKTSPKGPLAMMRPRVKCSRCDFTGKQGKEMDSHVERKHKTEFKCKVCNFVTRTKALRRRHMKTNHESKVKCDSCNIEADNESSLKTHRQAEHGIVSSSLGFMLTSEREVDENCEIDEAVVNGGNTKKRKTKSDYLKETKKLKLQKSKKHLTRSMKDQYLTLRKNVANLQRIHGVDAEFALIVKNNIQTQLRGNIWCIQKEI